MEAQYQVDSDVPSMINAQEYEYIEVQSDNTAGIEDDTQFRFELKDTNSFTNLSRAYLQVRFKLVRNDTGADLPAQTATLNNALNSSIGTLFSRAVLRINNMVCESTDNCHLVNSLKPLVLYSNDYSSSSSTNELFYLHDGGDLGANIAPYTSAGADLASLVVSDNVNYNPGYAKSQARTNGSAVTTAILPLENLCDFASVDKVLTNCNVAVELTRSQASYHLFRIGGVDAKVSIQKISLWVPRIVPQPELELELKGAFSGGLVSNFRFNKWNGYLPAPFGGAGVQSVRVATMSERVTGVFVMCKPTAITQLVNSNKTSDTLTDLFVRVNGKQYPSRAYNSLTTNDEGKCRAYLNLLDYQNRGSDTSSGIQLSRENWNNQSIYYVNTESMTINDSKSPSTIEINCTTSAACQLHVVLVSEKLVSVNYTGNQPQVSVF